MPKLKFNYKDLEYSVDSDEVFISNSIDSAGELVQKVQYHEFDIEEGFTLGVYDSTDDSVVGDFKSDSDLEVSIDVLRYYGVSYSVV